jgi:hypothetical protein
LNKSKGKRKKNSLYVQVNFEHFPENIKINKNDDFHVQNTKKKYMGGTDIKIDAFHFH